MLESINPYNLEALKKYPEMNSDTVDTAIQETHSAFESWRKTTFSERAKLFKNLGDVLRKNADDYAFVMSQEMGKLLTESKAEILKCATNCDYYAEKAEIFLQDKIVSADIPKSYITFQPIGVVLAIMPWNFPFWQVLRFACPTLMAGNTTVLKHASNVTGCSQALEEAFLEAGFPKNVFKSLFIKSKDVARIIENKHIKAVTLTGSTSAGQSVAEKAGRHLKKCVLELGGSDPYIILPESDIQKAVGICFQTRMLNAGQSCIAGKRFIIHESLYDSFKIEFKNKMKSVDQGDPMFPDTTLAPLATVELRDKLHAQVLAAVKHGATVALGGDYPLGRGAFYNPTLLENISEDNPAYNDEFFGPVALLFKYKNIEDALQIANGTDFGLGSGIIGNAAVAEELARNEMQAGNCFVNSFVKSTPELPFGGIKQSGYGRELSHFGIYEFVNIKTISITKSE